MRGELPDVEYQRLWKRLQQVGLNAYEARSYLVLVGHPKFKALELATRAHVPRQKIYEVLDSLVEKGFAQVVREKTKLFSAVEPSLAIPAYFARRSQMLQQELSEQSRYASDLVEDLNQSYSQGQGGRGTLDFLRIVSEPLQTATEYRRMMGDATGEFLEFSRPPYAIDPLDDPAIRAARQRGVRCRLLVEMGTLDDDHRRRLVEFMDLGVEVHQVPALPLKLALFDGQKGLLALLDPVLTKPTWTAVVFDHRGLGEAMQGLFEQYWQRSVPMPR